MSSFQIIIGGFLAVILMGAFILMLPISSRSGEVTPFIDALFTATSATCVTGLVVFDTASYWSYFGQAVILILIQIGGMGVITIAAAVTMISGKKIGLMQRSTMKEAIAGPNVGGIVGLTKLVIKATLLIELAGAALMMPVFIKDHGLRGIWMAFFHAISAFCNAGFDLMGTPEAPFVSLTGYTTHPLINVVIMLLIILGGIGFLTWQDVCTHKLRLRKYRLQSKVILITSALLIVIPSLLFFIFEYRDFTLSERIWSAIFQSVTARTAGFNSADLTLFGEGALVLMMFLMLVGGSPGSTAGGMKTTTVAVLFSSAVSVFRKKKHVPMLNRRISDETVKNASAILLLYLTFFVVGGVIISVIEDLPLMTCLFETASAIATVGLTLGITPALSTASHVILIVLMFIGRIGCLTLIYATFKSNEANTSKNPMEQINVG